MPYRDPDERRRRSRENMARLRRARREQARFPVSPVEGPAGLATAVDCAAALSAEYARVKVARLTVSERARLVVLLVQTALRGLDLAAFEARLEALEGISARRSA